MNFPTVAASFRGARSSQDSQEKIRKIHTAGLVTHPNNGAQGYFGLDEY